MSDDRLLFGYLRRKLGTLQQAEVDEFNAVLREWKAANGLGSPPEPREAPPAAGGTPGPSEPGSRAGGRLRPSEKAFALISSFEGLHRVRPDGLIEAYPDPATGGAPWTIGYGTTGPDVKPGTVWTRATAEARFRDEVTNKYGAGVNRLLGDAPTTQSQFDALVSFAYNVGLDEDADTIAEGLGDSTLLRKHKAGDYEGAAAQFGKWVNANGRRLNGLVRRRAAEADLYRGRV